MFKKLFVGLFFSLLILFGTVSENFAQKALSPKADPNNAWFLLFSKAMTYVEDHPESLVVVINRAKNSKDAPVAKLEKDVAKVLTELKLNVPFKIFAGNSNAAATYYGLYNANDSDDKSFDAIGDEFKKKAQELAEKIKAENLF